jgi:hypothetical protein
MYLVWSIAKVSKVVVVKRDPDELGLTAGKPNSRARYSANSLPANIKLLWASTFCPLWRDYLGTLADPWRADDPSFDGEMQLCFDAVYGVENSYGKIVKNDVVHAVVSSFLDDWSLHLFDASPGHPATLRVEEQVRAEGCANS